MLFITGDAEVVQYVFEYLNNEIFCNLSNKSKYIPLVPDKQSKTSGRDSIIPMPLSLPEAYYFENKGNRQDLLRRLYKKEKYKLPPIGNRPIIRQNVITGELLGAFSLQLCCCFVYFCLVYPLKLWPNNQTLFFKHFKCAI